jgi:hypothetical protein
MPNKNRFYLNLNKEHWILIFFILLKIALCAFPVEYGYFRDELYILAHTQHLDYGYLAIPPLLPFCVAIVKFLVGDSIFVMHLFAALVGSITLILTKMIVKKMDGGWLALLIALICVTLAPSYVSIGSRIIYDLFNMLFWFWALYTIVALIKTENKKYWLYFGIATGLGLLSKLDMLFLGAGLISALLFTPQRKYLASYQFWLGGLIAFLIFSPYLIWNIEHNFITLEFFRNYTGRAAHWPLWQIIRTQIMSLNLFAFPSALLGLYYFLFNQAGKKFRLLGLAFITTFTICVLVKTKFYVVLPFYSVLFVGGAMMMEMIAKKIKLTWLWLLYGALIFVTGLLFAPLVRPILPISQISAYTDKATRMIDFLLPGGGVERAEEVQIKILDNISIDYHDRFGWEEMAAKVSEIYLALPKDQQKNTYVLARNFGEAGAIDFYRSKYPLPPVICGHEQYYLWIPKTFPEKINIIAFRGKLEDVKKDCFKAKQVATLRTPYAVYYENNLPIFYCERLKKPINQLIEEIKNLGK